MVLGTGTFRGSSGRQATQASDQPVPSAGRFTEPVTLEVLTANSGFCVVMVESASSRIAASRSSGAKSRTCQVITPALDRPVDTQVLGFGEFLESAPCAFAAEATLLDTAERCRRIRYQSPVDADHTCVDLFTDTHCALQLSGEYVSRKAHFGGVDEADQLGIIFPGDDRCDGAEDLLIEDIGVCGDIDQHGRRVEPALAFGYWLPDG